MAGGAIFNENLRAIDRLGFGGFVCGALLVDEFLNGLAWGFEIFGESGESFI